MITDAAIQTSAEALLGCVKRIRTRGWCEGTSGNYSLTLDRDPLRLLITPSGVDKGRMEAEEFLVVDVQGNPAGPATGRPSAETALHLLLAERAGAGAVLHTHSVWGTLLGERFVREGGFRLRGYEMLKGLRGVHDHEEQVHVPVVPNTQDMPALAHDLGRLIDRHPQPPGFLIAGHGLYTWGEGLEEAFRHVEIFEFLFGLVGRRVRLDPFEG